jgi:hypothetical protein
MGEWYPVVRIARRVPAVGAGLMASDAVVSEVVLT